MPIIFKHSFHYIGHGDNGEVYYGGIDIDTGELVIITEWIPFENPNLKKLSVEDPVVKDCFKQVCTFSCSIFLDF